MRNHSIMVRSASLYAILLIPGLPPAPLQESPDCAGELCSAEVMVVPVPDVALSVGFQVGGTSININDCGPCEDCFAIVDYDYTGSGEWSVLVRDSNNHIVRYQEGSGSTFGFWAMETGCDSTPFDYSFSSPSGIAGAQLSCTCVP